MRRKILAIRKLKYFFFKLGIHKFLGSHSFNFIGHLSALSKWISDHPAEGFTDFPTKQFVYDKRFELHQFVIDTEIKNEAIDYLEFGVAKGGSFRWWVEHRKESESRFYGFDTFTGLPEDWGPFKAGAMSNGNEPPAIDDSRVRFFQGIFQQTLFGFLKTYDSKNRKVIHLDADLYSSTLFVLTSLSPYLKAGDILLFDEFNVPLHEYKAFQEWVNSFYISYKVLGEVNNYYQVAMKVL